MTIDEFFITDECGIVRDEEGYFLAKDGTKWYPTDMCYTTLEVPADNTQTMVGPANVPPTA